LATRDSRAIRLGLLTIGTLVVLARGLPALRRAEAAARERESLLLSQASAIGREAVTTLEGAQLVAGLKPEERANLAALAFDAASVTELLATTSQYLSGVASTIGVSVHSIDPAVDSTWAGAGTRVVINMSLSGSGAELLRFIDELASSPRLAVVERIEVRVRSTELAASERETLSASLRVAAFGSTAVGDRQ
jgi:hypothetical protein